MKRPKSITYLFLVGSFVPLAERSAERFCFTPTAFLVLSFIIVNQKNTRKRLKPGKLRWNAPTAQKRYDKFTGPRLHLVVQVGPTYQFVWPVLAGISSRREQTQMHKAQTHMLAASRGANKS